MLDISRIFTELTKIRVRIFFCLNERKLKFTVQLQNKINAGSQLLKRLGRFIPL